MNKGILLDTDVLIDYFRGISGAVTFIQEESERLVFSVITTAEIYAGARATETAHFDDFFSFFPIIPITSHIAKTGGLLKSEYGPSHNVGIADALIAATAIEENLNLISLNVKHYPMFEHLQPPYKR
jgi:hypothetical protein